ncbi:putative transposable element [Trichonephila clavipes]|nr:putative transposable element [Trichonephila clavipes]
MVWGAIANDSRSTLIVMRGTLTGQRYVDDILRPHVGSFLNGLPEAIFQQDNARPHTARVAQDYLRHFQTLPWPARSHDLSPVEHVWDQLKRQMPGFHSVHDLELAVQDLWAHLPQDNIRCLINSMPDRVAACIAAGDKNTTFLFIKLTLNSSQHRNIFTFNPLGERYTSVSVRVTSGSTAGSCLSQPPIRPSAMLLSVHQMTQNDVPLDVFFIDGDSQMTPGAKSGEQRGCNWLVTIHQSLRMMSLHIVLKLCQVIYSQFALAIHQNDHQARRRFVEWAQNEIAVVPDFHKRILFSDEAHFWLNGYVNKQNCRIWSEANPQVYVEIPLHSEKLAVWCALWAGGIIGPYFFKNDEGHNVTVNGDRYRAMITNFFIPELNNNDVQELWFQQDGAKCHTARATYDLLKDKFSDRLISRFGPVNWPPRSCDLTPLDYFLWGYVKSLVYSDKPQMLDHLEDNIRRVIADIRPQMLEKVIENWTSRLDYIQASRGSYMPEIVFKI